MKKEKIMKILQYDDWKEKIAFDNFIYKSVRRHSLQLNTFEREIVDVQIDYYRTHFSLLQIMNHFKTLKTDLAKTLFIKEVLKRQDELLYIPKQLQDYFQKKIRNEFKEFEGFFNLMLDKALDKKPVNTIIAPIKTILGEYYKPVIKFVDKYRKMKPIRVVQRTLKPGVFENMAREQIYNVQQDLVLTKIFGRSSIRRNVPISIVDEYGYGEWVSKHISPIGNKFFLYSNANRLTDEELEHMIYFNIYPGKGHFYNTILNPQKNICFDNGATFLINGWAMFAMCHTRSSAHAMSLMSEGSVICHHLLSKNLEKAYDFIFFYLLSKFPKAKAIRYLVDYTQYPGHYLSYILGGFATDLVIKNHFASTPADYLETLSTINCGDFFALYSPKMQSKIAKSNIVAKVSSKFNQV